MNLHEHKEEFQNLVTLTSDYLGIPEVFIEKDYWVTYVLYNLHHSDVSEEVVFKGGTSLSKAHKLINS
jgi:predicted nucleotidyltransferase component of viral defense system